MNNKNSATIYLKDYQVPDYLIHTVALSITLDEQRTRVVSTLTMQRNPASDNPSPPLELLGEQLDLVSLTLDGQPLTEDNYKVTDESLTLAFVPLTDSFTLVVETIINPKTNTALEGLYLSNEMLCTQCEAEGFRKITYYLDRPDVMAKFTTTLIADKRRYPVLLSNGNKIATGELDNHRHWVKWEDPFAKPCYLFALVAGTLEPIEDHFTTMTGRKITLQIFVEAHDKAKCLHAMASLKEAMTWDEKVYGREYDLDLYMIVAVSHFNMGAMENKGLNIFNTKFVLASPDTATDTDYEHIAAVIAHEYFHNWSGNRITCRDWFQLSLKEGFTVFRDQSFTADHTSQGVKRIEDVNLLRMRQFVEDAGPLAHPIRPEAYIEINNFYTLTVYEKGAEVVRMLQTLLGKAGFRAGSDLYFERHDGQAVTCDDFIQAMEAANTIDLSQFKRWYSQAGTPEIDVSQQYDETANTLTLTLEQHSQSHEPLLIPLKMGLLNHRGEPEKIKYQGTETVTDEITLQLTDTKQQFVFEGLSEKPVLSLLRDFSAPIKLNLAQPLDELAFLLRYDSDPFNRWEAGQKLAASLIFSLIEAIQQGQELTLKPILIETFTHLLAQEWTDLSYLSLLLTLPAELYLAEQMVVIDVDAIHQAREFVRTQLAEKLHPQFYQLYQTHHQPNSDIIDAIAIGKRRIKNSCLSYLTQLETEKSQHCIGQQFKTATTMTDQITALGLMVNSQHPEKTEHLEAFYQQWQHEALVIDKWFSLQASSPLAESFTQIQNLMTHPAFDLKNPNRTRSLIGAFSQGNPVCYHAKNGEGYQFLADNVIALNAINPQVASRMVTGLTQWRRFDKERQQLMKIQLERIVKTAGISKDVYELASKSLS
ncbi:MAG: aminopeptidase N [Methylococcales bacterium]|nr:aminopeptidase N [Methylococcales bacterium]